MLVPPSAAQGVVPIQISSVVWEYIGFFILAEVVASKIIRFSWQVCWVVGSYKMVHIGCY